MRKILIEKGGLEFSFNVNENNNVILDDEELNILYLYYSLESKLLNNKLSEKEFCRIKLLQEAVKELIEIIKEK